MSLDEVLAELSIKSNYGFLPSWLAGALVILAALYPKILKPLFDFAHGHLKKRWERKRMIDEQAAALVKQANDILDSNIYL